MKVHLSRRFSSKQLRGLLSNLTLVPPTLHPSQTAFSHSPTLPPYSSPSFLPQVQRGGESRKPTGRRPTFLPSSFPHFGRRYLAAVLVFSCFALFRPNNSQDTGSVLLTLNVKERQKRDQMQGKILAWPPLTLKTTCNSFGFMLCH